MTLARYHGGGFGIEFFSKVFEEKSFHVAFVGIQMEMDIFFGKCCHTPVVQVRENPEFHDSVQRDKSNWPRCLL